MRSASIFARVLASLLLAASLAGSMNAAADQQDPRLGDLFVGLAEAPDSATALPIEATIWQIWLDGGDSKLNELMAQGVEAMSARRFRDAAGRFTDLILAAPAFAEAWNKRATVYYLMDRIEDSVRDIERTLALEPRHFGAISGMGLIFLERGDEEGALDAFEKVLEIHPHARGARLYVERLRERLPGKRIREDRSPVPDRRVISLCPGMDPGPQAGLAQRNPAFPVRNRAIACRIRNRS